MSYRFGAGQPILQEVQRIFSEELESAINQLTKDKNEDHDQGIHEARKNIKKTRALLRLIAPQMSKAAFRSENGALREIGRKLSELRDARAIIEIFEALIKETGERNPLPDDLVQAVCKQLADHKIATEQKIGIEEALGSAVTALKSVRDHVAHYEVNESGFSALQRGLKNTYRCGRKAMKQAEASPDGEHFHNWRKRVKDHWYHVRLLGELKTPFVKTREDDLEKLGTWLGDDHNLVVLSDTINADRNSFGHRKQVRHFLTIVKQHRLELRGKSLALGEQLYDFKPKQLISELQGAQDLWPTQQKEGAADHRKSNRLSKNSNKPSLTRTARRSSSPSANEHRVATKQLKKKVASAPTQRSHKKARV